MYFNAASSDEVRLLFMKSNERGEKGLFTVSAYILFNLRHPILLNNLYKLSLYQLASNVIKERVQKEICTRRVED